MVYLIQHRETGATYSDREDKKLLAFNNVEDVTDFITDNNLEDIAKYVEDFFLTGESEDIHVIEYNREDQD